MFILCFWPTFIQNKSCKSHIFQSLLFASEYDNRNHLTQFCCGPIFCGCVLSFICQNDYKITWAVTRLFWPFLIVETELLIKPTKIAINDVLSYSTSCTNPELIPIIMFATIRKTFCWMKCSVYTLFPVFGTINHH